MRNKFLILMFLSFFAGNVIAETDKVEKKGVANVTNVTAKANIVVNGPLNAKHGNFNGNLTISSDHSVFNDTTVRGNVTIKSVSPAVFEMHCGTKISGGITFVGMPGIVKRSTDSILCGKVINGKIEEIKTPEKCEPAQK